MSADATREALDRLARAIKALAEFAPEGTPVGLTGGQRVTYFETSPSQDEETHRRWAELDVAQKQAREALASHQSKPVMAGDVESIRRPLLRMVNGIYGQEAQQALASLAAIASCQSEPGMADETGAVRALVAKLDDGHWPSMVLEQIENEMLSIIAAAMRKREDELDTVMYSVDKWFQERDPTLKDNPATRAAEAERDRLRKKSEALWAAALDWYHKVYPGDYVALAPSFREALLRAETPEPAPKPCVDDLLLQEICSLREKLKIAAEAIKAYDHDFDVGLFLHQVGSVDYEQLMEDMAAEGDTAPKPEGRTCDGAEAIRRERERQKAVEGWTPEHDDKQKAGELAQAAACYAMPPPMRDDLLWPWDAEWWKPSGKNRKRELEKAGALIAAEWDRIDRRERAASDGKEKL